MRESRREHVEVAVLDNEKVLFHWCMLTTEINGTRSRNVCQTLDHSTCGFSFTSAWLEQQKKDTTMVESSTKGYTLDFALDTPMITFLYHVVLCVCKLT